MEVARDLGLGPGEIRRVLDFGCGPGRGLRLFHAHADLLELHGTDVDETAISWCRRNLDFAEFHLNAEEPPLDFSDSSFDLVFSISVFSHFSAPTAAAWLAELRRLIRPGGIAVLSVHGRHALERAANEAEIFAMLEIDEQALGAAREAFETDGFAFVSQPGGHLSEARYGVAFVDERHLRTTWTEVFELVEVRRAAIDDWQDLVVLRRP